MKKLLALVLALVMTLGLATVGASAATVKYADKNDIDYQEAAEVLSKVGVFEGKGENFAPKDNLNRAEAAKLVAYLMLGTKTAEAIKGNGNKFSDVPADHWACGYIEYLASAGVVSGVGGGNFNPNGQVTAVQFAKMLNVALGYDAQVEGYVGESWNINIMKQANDDKIFNSLEIGSNDALTREQAAQMCLNALKADVVEYESKGDTLTINNSTVVLNAKKAKDKISGDSKAMKIKNDPVVGGYTLQLGEDRYNGDLEMINTTDDFGRPASEWRYKTEKIGTYVKRGDILQTYTGELKRGPLYDLLGKAIYDDMIDARTDLYFFEDGVPYGTTTIGRVSSTKAEIEKFVQKNGDKKINDDASTGNGTLTEVFVNDDKDEVTISVINTYAYKASSDYRASTEDIVIAPANKSQINLDSTRLELEDFPEIKDLKKDDYILITAYQNSGSTTYKAKTAAKAEVLTAKVDKYVYNDTVTLDGNVTKYSKKVTADSKTTEYSVGQEATVVLDKYGYIIHVDEAVVSSNYVFISEMYQGNGSNTSKVKANAYFTDGTNSEITIKEISNLTSLSKTAMAGTPTPGGHIGSLANTIGVVANDRYAGWYTYSKNTAGEYTLNKVPSNRVESGFQKTDAGDLTKSDAVTFLNNTNVNLLTKDSNASGTFYQLDGAAASTIKANDKTMMVVTYAENNDVDIYTGVKNLPDINLAATDGTKAQGQGVVFVVSDTSGYAKFVFVSLQGNWSVYGTENESLLYIIKTDKKNVASTDTTYYTYKALDENAKEIKIEGDSKNVFGNPDGTDDTYMAFYKTSKNADGRYTRGSKVPNSVTGSLAKYINKTGLSSASGATIDADNGTLTIAGDSFTLENNYKLVVVSKADPLNKLQGADYEANIVTADSLAAMVKGYDVVYNIQAKLKDNYVTGKGGKIIEAYVTITSAVANANSANGASSSATDGDVIALVVPSLANLEAGAGKNPVVAYYAGSKKPSTETVAALTELYLYTNYGGEFSNVSGTDYTVKVGNTTYSNTLSITSAYILPAKDFAGSWTDTKLYTGNVVVMDGKELTVPAGQNMQVKGDVIADGTLTVAKGGTLDVTGKLEVTKNGDIVNHGTIKVNGTLVVDYDSKSLTSDGNITATNLEIAGDATFNGGVVTVNTKTTLKNGANANVSDAIFNAGTVDAKAGSSTNITGSDITITQLNTEAGSTVSTTKCTGSVTLGTNKGTVTGTVETAKELTVTNSLSGVVDYSVTGDVKFVGSAYKLDVDAKSITISLKQTEKNPSASIAATLALIDLTYGTDKDSNADVTVPVTGEASVTLALKENATAPKITVSQKAG